MKYAVLAFNAVPYIAALSASHAPEAIKVLNEFAAITTTKIHDGRDAGPALGAAHNIVTHKRNPDSA